VSHTFTTNACNPSLDVFRYRHGHTRARWLGVRPPRFCPHNRISLLILLIRYETLIVGGSGVSSTVVAWGDLMLQRGGKRRTQAGADVAVGTLG